MRRVKLGLLALALLSLVACAAVPVAEDLDQFQANEIISLLSSQGIAASASRETSGRGKYSVTVDRSYYTQAKSLLAERGLPSPPRPSLKEILQPSSFLPNSREVEALRLDHALAIELEDTLATHPAIAAVKIIVRSRTVPQGQDSTVSVILQQRAGQELQGEDIKTIIKRSVPGVKPENVFLSVTTDTVKDQNQVQVGVYQGQGEVLRVPLVPFLFNWRVPEDDYNAMTVVLVACFLILAVIGGLVGYWFGFYHHMKNADLSYPEISARSLRLDRPGRDAPEI